jgi:hypothetical protein
MKTVLVTGATGDRGSLLTQTARFKPRGLAGLLYWIAVLPFHRFVFRGMLRGIRESAETLSSSPTAGEAAAEGPTV